MPENITGLHGISGAFYRPTEGILIALGVYLSEEKRLGWNRFKIEKRKGGGIFRPYTRRQSVPFQSRLFSTRSNLRPISPRPFRLYTDDSISDSTTLHIHRANNLLPCVSSVLRILDGEPQNSAIFRRCKIIQSFSTFSIYFHFFVEYSLSY